jgi:hypothetical protein
MKFISNKGMNHTKRRQKEMMRNGIETKNKEAPFQRFFMKNDENQTVESIEADEIDFEEVKRHRENGESLCITQKKEQKPDVNLIAYEQVKEP